VTQLPVLGVVSETWLDKHKLRRRGELLRYSAAAAALLIVFVVVLKFSDLGVHLL
jgi:hypothetical protein